MSLTSTFLMIKTLAKSVSMADAESLYCAFVLLALILLSPCRASRMIMGTDHDDDYQVQVQVVSVKGNQLLDKACDEIYVVGEGETLHTISDKCGDPFIVERNPHVHDPDDVFPGLVLKIAPSIRSRKLLR